MESVNASHTLTMCKYVKHLKQWLVLVSASKHKQLLLLLLNYLSSQDGGVGKHGSPSHTTTAKITTKLQNNYHPESSEKQHMEVQQPRN